MTTALEQLTLKGPSVKRPIKKGYVMKPEKDQNEKVGGDKRKFEYLVRSILSLQNAHGGLSQETLSDLGSEGWHLVYVHQGHFIFEREA